MEEIGNTAVLCVAEILAVVTLFKCIAYIDKYTKKLKRARRAKGKINKKLIGDLIYEICRTSIAVVFCIGMIIAVLHEIVIIK